MKVRIRIIIYYLLELILSLSILGFISLMIVKFTIYSPGFMKKQFTNNNYYHELYNSINDEMSNYILQSGLPEEVLDNIFTEEMLKEDITSMIDAIYSDTKKVTINHLKVKENLEVNIDNYLLKNNIAIEDEEALTRFVDQMLDVYDREIGIANVFTYIEKVISNTKSILNIVIFGLAVLSFLIMIILFTFKSDVFSIAFLTSGLISLFIYLYVTNSVNIANLTIWNTGVSKVLQSIILDILDRFKIISIILLIIGAFYAAIYKLLHRKRIL